MMGVDSNSVNQYDCPQRGSRFPGKLGLEGWDYVDGKDIIHKGIIAYQICGGGLMG